MGCEIFAFPQLSGAHCYFSVYPLIEGWTSVFHRQSIVFNTPRLPSVLGSYYIQYHNGHFLPHKSLIKIYLCQFQSMMHPSHMDSNYITDITTASSVYSFHKPYNNSTYLIKATLICFPLSFIGLDKSRVFSLQETFIEIYNLQQIILL